jgi:presenilin-like A22 family membrane protease
VQLLSLVCALRMAPADPGTVDGSTGIGASVVFFALILVTSGVLIIIIKKGFSRYLYRITEYTALFFIPLFMAASLTNSLVAGLITGVAFVALRALVRRREATIALSFVLAVSIATILGITFGPVPILILLALLSLYDFIAVKKTKHMLVLAEDVIKRKGPQILTFESGNEKIMIGLADLIFPSALFVSAYLDATAAVAALTGIGSVAGMILLLKSPMDEGMPAIPFVSLGGVGYIIGILLL